MCSKIIIENLLSDYRILLLIRNIGFYPFIDDNWHESFSFTEALDASFIFFSLSHFCNNLATETVSEVD